MLTAVHERAAGVVDDVGDLVAALQGHAGDHARQRACDVLEGVVVVVAHDHLPRSTEPAAGSVHTR